MKRDPYIAIMEAARRGRGVRLTRDEVWDLSFDDAIETTAQNRREERAKSTATVPPASAPDTGGGHGG